MTFDEKIPIPYQRKNRKVSCADNGAHVHMESDNLFHKSFISIETWTSVFTVIH